MRRVKARFWPRWVMESNFGLGGITFYTYPPLGYWAGALLRRVSGLDIPGTLALAVMLWRLVFLLGCYLWLRRHVAPGAALAAAPDGFTVADFAARVRAQTGQTSDAYGARQAAYDLKKLRGKQLILKRAPTRRYEPTPEAVRT